MKLIRRFSTESFYQIINVLLLLVGLKMIWSAGAQIVRFYA